MSDAKATASVRAGAVPAAVPAANPNTDPDTGHDYDGIHEYDNRLPNWWLAILFVSIIFGYGYFIWYHVLDGPSQHDEFAREEAEYLRKAGPPPADDATLLALSKSPAMHDTAQGLFVANCASCHLASGAGVIGPNLTDDFWIHGDTPHDIYTTIYKGVPSKGMLTWGPILGAEKVKLLAAYILTFRGKPVPGKAPEGVESKL